MTPLLEQLSTTTWGVICSIEILAIVAMAIYIRSQAKWTMTRLTTLIDKHAEALETVHKAKDEQGQEFLKMLSDLSSDSIAQLKDLGATLDSIKDGLERVERRAERD